MPLFICKETSISYDAGTDGATPSPHYHKCHHTSKFLALIQCSTTPFKMLVHMDDIDLDLFAAAAMKVINIEIAEGDVRARSANRVLHRRSNEFTAAGLIKLEPSECHFAPFVASGTNFPNTAEKWRSRGSFQCNNNQRQLTTWHILRTRAGAQYTGFSWLSPR